MGDGGIITAVILCAILGLVLGLMGGVLGLAFRNDGRTKMSFDKTDFLLPFAGERYCVQSHRGYVSHYFKRSTDPHWMDYDEEPSYDWSLPEGEPLLCAKEGHITAYRDDLEGNKRTNGNTNPNYVAIRHFDKTVALYLHLMKEGVTGGAWNAGLDQAVTNHPDENTYYRTTEDPNPLHVFPGDVIGANGDTGISMFPHLHLYLLKPRATFTTPAGPDGSIDPAPDTKFIAFKFSDGNVGRHDGQCWSMRKYASDNANRGLLVIAPNQAPFRPGGTPTDGSPVPGSPLAPAAGPGGEPTPPGLPDAPTPPIPSGPAPPPGSSGPPPVPPPTPPATP
jgi:murein DD-endopeptidase MepM/ murein hydrolase activator NlpD